MPFFFRRYRIAAATIPSTAPESENRNVRLRTSAVIARAKGSLLKLLSAGAAAVSHFRFGFALGLLCVNTLKASDECFEYIAHSRPAPLISVMRQVNSNIAEQLRRSRLGSEIAANDRTFLINA